MHLPQHRMGHRNAGFALLITITLLSFLVLLLVSLASLTRVETQVASNNQQLVQARQNAMLALNIAIGQLQKYAGPDQRTTSRADIDSALSNDAQKNGRWTGVYGSRAAANYADRPDQIADTIATAYSSATGPDEVNQPGSLPRKGSQAILLNWLVSGNEGTAFNPLSDVAADGHITLTTSPIPVRKPADTVALATTPALPSTADSYALLVGDNSVDVPSTSSTPDRVAAPLVAISVPEGTLPGFTSTSTTPKTVGRYAWWVGDENTKARVNLSSLVPDSSGQPSIPASQAFVVAQRTAAELADDFSAYDPTKEGVRKMLELQQVQMLDAGLVASRKKRFHDFTTWSNSLLTDTYAGGLKKDLSALLATGAASPADTDYLFTSLASSPKDSFGIPTWGKLRSFVRQTASGNLISRLPSDTDVGIAPVMTFAEIGLEYFNNGGSARLAVFPRAVLWNPYTSPLAPARYEFGVNTAATAGLFQLQGKLPPATNFSAKEGTRYLGTAAGTAPSTVTNGYLRFVIDVTEPIPPGESHIFVLNGSAQDYSAPYSGQPGNILTRGVLGTYAILPDTGMTVGLGETFRVAGKGPNHLPALGASRTFENNASAYLGAVASSGPDGPAWPAANKPWYQVIGRAGESGSASYDWLQGGSAGADLPLTPGTNIWGLQIRFKFAGRIRYVANTNPRAPFKSGPPYQLSRSVESHQGTSLTANDFDPSPDARASAAIALDVVTGAPVNNVLFEFRPSDTPLLSLGQLQHANLSFLIDQPAYPFGNSLAPYIHLNSNKTTRDRLQRSETISTVSPSTLLSGHYDISYLLNRALWDRYFVSTVPHDGTNAAGVNALPDILPNARLIRPEPGIAGETGDLADADKAAARLRLAGGFNINSTSEQAWRAVLGGINRLDYKADGTADNKLDAALPRFAAPLAPAAINGTTVNWAFSGYRRLTPTQINALAANIVTEIRNRGPFISLGDFVNRRLRDNPNTTTPSGTPFNADETLKGPLQNAIDNTSISGAGSINNSRNRAPFNATATIDANASTTQLDGDAMRGGPPVTAGGTAAQFPYGSLVSFEPQFLTQADVLSAIGPSLSARSDTFTVRTYGETQNPVTGEITGRAWCEAVVQRTVEPVNRKSTNSTLADYNEPAAATPTTPDFGRRFKITSFRWLSPSDL